MGNAEDISLAFFLPSFQNYLLSSYCVYQALCWETVLFEGLGLVREDSLVCDSLEFRLNELGLMRATWDSGDLEGGPVSLPPDETVMYLFIGSFNG